LHLGAYPEETIEFMSTTKIPWIGFKVLAAGAIHGIAQPSKQVKGLVLLADCAAERHGELLPRLRRGESAEARGRAPGEV
jgi:hypothetical protein